MDTYKSKNWDEENTQKFRLAKANWTKQRNHSKYLVKIIRQIDIFYWTVNYKNIIKKPSKY